MALTKAQILDTVSHLPVLTREVEGLGEVCFRPMSAMTRDILRRQMKGEDGKYNPYNIPQYEIRVVIATACDPQGRLLFRLPDDLETVGELPMATIEAMAEFGLEASGMKEESLEDAEKNSETTPSDG